MLEHIVFGLLPSMLVRYNIKFQYSPHIKKIALFALDNHKYGFSVMTFGSINAPTFYSDTMSNFKDKWVKLFIICVKALSYTDGEPVRVTD